MSGLELQQNSLATLSSSVERECYMRKILLTGHSLALAAILWTSAQGTFLPNSLMGMKVTGVTGQLAGTQSGDLINNGSTAAMPSIATPNQLMGRNATAVTGQLPGTQNGDVVGDRNAVPMPAVATPNRLMGMNATGVTGQLPGTQSGDMLSNGNSTPMRSTAMEA